MVGKYGRDCGQPRCGLVVKSRHPGALNAVALGTFFLLCGAGPAACLRFECSTFDSTCRPDALLPYLLLNLDDENQAAACGVYPPARVSVTSDGSQGGSSSRAPAISADGRYVAFRSGADLVADDTNAAIDVFVHDRATGETTRVSVTTDGAQANGNSDSPRISADGRYVAFLAQARNLVPGDTNLSMDAFVRDRQLGVTTRVSVATDGTESDASVLSLSLGLSSDGRYVAFASTATNLVAGDTNGNADLFLHDRETGVTTRESVNSGGAEATGGAVGSFVAISRDGQYLAFESDQTNLVAGDTNAQSDIFIRDILAGTTTRVSVASGGAQGSGGDSSSASISADGRVVAFHSEMTNLVADDTNGVFDIFVHDRATGETTRASVASDGSEATGGFSVTPALNADGRYVAFRSAATNLVADDLNGNDDVFIHDRQSGATSRLSVSLSGGAEGDGSSSRPLLSADCPYAAFDSAATNLVPSDTNAQDDVFVVDLP